jgi:uncharacterized membrane protein YadS
MGIGMLLRNAFIIPPAYKAGIFFSMRQTLRFAVALLGIRITFDRIIGLGWEGLAIALVPLCLTMIYLCSTALFFVISSYKTLLCECLS